MPAIDVFHDFSRLPTDLLDGIAARVTCSAPSSKPIEACNRAIAAAAAFNRPLLVLLGQVEPSSEAVGLLLEALGTDPMIGFACPRMTGTGAHGLRRLDIDGDRAIDQLPRRLLSEIPETYLVADAPSRCLVIKPEILANFGELDPRFRTLAAALWHYLARARRCGFRTVVCNRAVVFAPGGTRPCPPSAVTFRSLPEADRALLTELLPEVERTQEEFGTHALAHAEARLARAMPQAYGTTPSLLLDVRNVGQGMNGTAIAALGISSGLYALDADWEVTLLASRDGATVHQLAAQYPRWTVTTTLPARQFTAAVRLSQPWVIQEMLDLHHVAAFNVYLFLDTISWDIAYTAPRHLDGTWRFMADHADGLLFISEFTRQRFYRRFASGADCPSLVPYLSFDPADYIHPEVRAGAAKDDYIFVIGNAYDHKDVSQTLELLTTAFPYQSIVALGPVPAPTPRVTVLASGTLSEREIHRLYAGARLVVFPSFYEGFGFPILTTLAYGRTVLARRSTLLDEIAARCAPQGRLVAFDRREELVELVGRLLHGEEVPGLSLGTILDHGRPRSWADVGESIRHFLATLVGDPSRSRWRSRDHIIRQLMAAPTSLIERGLKWPVVP